MRQPAAPAPPTGGDPREWGDARVELEVRFERDAMPMLDRLYGAALRFTGDRAEAAELILETYVKAYQAFGSVECDTSLRAWLYRILVDGHLDRCRRQGHRPGRQRTGETSGRQFTWRCGPNWTGLPSAEAQALVQLPVRAVKDALEKLPDDFLMAVYLADVEGFAYAEIAYIMSTSPGTVICRLRRGRRRLRDLLRHAAGAQVASTRLDASTPPAAATG
ncbi:MAG TPA: sigma-70 family RNA polymerase sigma factor [Sporichthyaceae bacterium]|jgi:RNA polymerase sigma-70 factor (ECF subfamily)|nr:sigma-70 family RNA polymerase sigma factor [Sporichthyaceae bacterium]